MVQRKIGISSLGNTLTIICLVAYRHGSALGATYFNSQMYGKNVKKRAEKIEYQYLLVHIVATEKWCALKRLERAQYATWMR